MILGFTTINLLRKNEKQEDILISYWGYLTKISEIISFSDNKLKEIDSRGTFKSDDEVGYFFKELQKLQDIMNDFNVETNGKILG